MKFNLLFADCRWRKLIISHFPFVWTKYRRNVKRKIEENYFFSIFQQIEFSKFHFSLSVEGVYSYKGWVEFMSLLRVNSKMKWKLILFIFQFFLWKALKIFLRGNEVFWSLKLSFFELKLGFNLIGPLQTEIFNWWNSKKLCSFPSSLSRLISINKHSYQLPYICIWILMTSSTFHSSFERFSFFEVQIELIIFRSFLFISIELSTMRSSTSAFRFCFHFALP